MGKKAMGKKAMNKGSRTKKLIIKFFRNLFIVLSFSPIKIKERYKKR